MQLIEIIQIILHTIGREIINANKDAAYSIIQKVIPEAFLQTG